VKRAIVIGATSGIGWEVARLLVQRGYAVGIAGRRMEKLVEFQQTLSPQAHIKQIDVSEQEEAITRLQELIAEMGGMDLIVISSGIGRRNLELEWPPEKETIEVNVLGFVAMATTAFRYFQQQGSGQIAGISSIAALRGGGEVPAYAQILQLISSRSRLPVLSREIGHIFLAQTIPFGIPFPDS